ncbi:MAG: L-aspartate oxidase [Magnetospiraceae bacterium]
MDRRHTDVLVIGAGLGGLAAALSLAPRKVLVVAKAPTGEGASSGMAQGGVAAAVGAEDHPTAHARDTVSAAAGLADAEAVLALTDAGRTAIDQLRAWGVLFDQAEDGSYRLGQEAAHGHRRILHAGGDATGHAIMKALGRAALAADHITLCPNVEITDFAQDAQGRVAGAVGFCQGRPVEITASAVILATGGLGQLYSHTTNPVESRGDGVAMAARAGARLKDMEFVQFHPTAIDVETKPLPLATEALRGEGGVLIDARGVRFMPAVHPDAELAPRDVVARAIWRQKAAGRGVFLDARACVGERFPERFPTVFRICQEQGIDPRVQPIPVAPAAHYHMGGVSTDLNGQTSLPGLWAVGEVACTGVHGANRLASNSLLEAAVFGMAAAREILNTTPPAPAAPIFVHADPGTVDIAPLIQTEMYHHVGLIRDAEGLNMALAELYQLLQSGPALTPGCRNMLDAALLVTAAAALRQESRGAHFRSDFPQTQAAADHGTISLADARALAASAQEQRVRAQGAQA